MFSIPRYTISDHGCDEGFSLLETLIALSILSIVSLAMFQSSIQLLSVSKKSIDIGDQIVDEYVFRQSFRNIVLNLTPAWQEQPDFIFSGQLLEFSGLSFIDDSSSLNYMTVFIKNIDNGRANIVVDTDNNRLVLGTLDAADLKFSYLAWDNNWYDYWPLENVPNTGFFDDNLFLDLPQMPLAIRLSSQSDQLFLVAARNKPEGNPINNANIP